MPPSTRGVTETNATTLPVSDSCYTPTPRWTHDRRESNTDSGPTGSDRPFSIPSRPALDALTEDAISDDQYRIAQAIVLTVNETTAPLAVEHCRQRVGQRLGPAVDVDQDLHDSTVKVLFEWNPNLFNWLVGQFPSSKTWLDINMAIAGVEAVTPATLNLIQQTCVQTNEQLREEYKTASRREFTEQGIADVTDDATTASSFGGYCAHLVDESGPRSPEPTQVEDTVDAIMDSVLDHVLAELSDRLDSIRNAGYSIAGATNELLAIRALAQSGLTAGSRDAGHDFDPSTSDADLTVYGDDAPDLSVEVKSTAMRERLSRSLTDNEIQWVVFGFLEDAAELRRYMLTKNEQRPRLLDSSVAAYVPPETVAAVAELDAARDDGVSAYTIENEHGLYVRSNEEFVADMHHYRETGTLRDLEPGHEDCTTTPS